MSKKKKIEIGTKVQSKKDPLIKGVVKSIRKDEDSGEELYVLTNNLRFTSEDLKII